MIKPVRSSGGVAAKYPKGESGEDYPSSLI